MKKYILEIDKSEVQALIKACTYLGISYEIHKNNNYDTTEIAIFVDDELMLFFLGIIFKENLSDEIIIEL